MIKHRYYICGADNEGKLIRSTCIDTDIIHCIQLYREQLINPFKVEQMEQVNANLTIGIEKIERCGYYV